jgi:hypothetical protein
VDIVESRLRAHRLSAPAATVVDAARHMLAVQSQEFTGGRWALAARTRGAARMRDVDAAFERGDLVRSWTMRGTIHTVPAGELAWMLSVTGERQRRQAAAIHRGAGIDDDQARRAEVLARAALQGGERLERAELFAALEAGGLSTAGQRGYHLLTILAVRGVVCLGPVVPRAGAPTRDQYVVLAEDWIGRAESPPDPAAEFFARFVEGHGPASARDFAWWAGLPLGVARAAAVAASPRLVPIEDGADPRYVAPASPRRSALAPTVIALPAFEEYYLSYADRSLVCAPEFLAAVGPSKNGIVRPILLASGRVVGVWAHSLAVGRHEAAPVPELFDTTAATADEVANALERYRAFVTA